MKSSRWLNRNVGAIGLTSLFSDISHEIATSILPVFLASLGAAPWALGVIEGVSDGLSSVAKLGGGWLSDRTGVRKPLAVAGYLVTAVSTAAIGWSSRWAHVLGGRALAWLGRGVRSPVRDAILADSIEARDYGKAFGFERALDTAGAILGPMAALVLLSTLSYRSIFFLTLVPGLLAAAIFAAAVRGRPTLRPISTAKVSFRGLPPRFRWFLVVVGVFGIGDFAHTLLILRATDILRPQMGEGAAGAAITLYLVHNVFYAGLSTPIGALGDRFGKAGVLSAGYALAAFMNLGFLFGPTHWLLLGSLFALGGSFIATEDALERAIAADLLPDHLKATGFGALAAVNAIGDLISSAVVGWVWAAVSPEAGFAYAAVLAIAGTVLMWIWGGARRSVTR